MAHHNFRCYTENKIAVRFEYEWHDEDGQWYRTHGNEVAKQFFFSLSYPLMLQRPFF